jgi:hypothetical protein
MRHAGTVLEMQLQHRSFVPLVLLRASGCPSAAALAEIFAWNAAAGHAALSFLGCLSERSRCDHHYCGCS